MATQRIPYSQNEQTSKMLAQAVNNTLVALADLRRIKGLMDMATYGNDWAALAAELGGGVTAQQAQDAWTLVSTALTAMDVSSVTQLSRLDQG